MDLVIRGACILLEGELRTVDIGVQGDAVAAISPGLKEMRPN